MMKKKYPMLFRQAIGTAKNMNQKYSLERVGQFDRCKHLDARMPHIAERGRTVRYDSNCGHGRRYRVTSGTVHTGSGGPRKPPARIHGGKSLECE